jgi:hypothetical protein
MRRAAGRHVRAGRRLAAAVWRDPLRALPSDRPAVRFLRGLLLPLGLARVIWREKAERARWLRVSITQALVVLAVALPIGIPATQQELRQWHLGEGSKLTLDLRGLTLFVVLAYVEWVVIALSRQYHDQIGRMASVRAGIPPEDPDRPPRVAVDLRWVWMKIKRRGRAFKAWVAGLPAIALFGLIPGIGGALFQILLLSWTFFWFACGAAGKTAYAWRTEGKEGAADPFFLRATTTMQTANPLFRWWLPRLYLRLWRRLTVGLFPPLREVEARGWEFVGLTTTRIVLGLPVIYLFVRPFLPVAAADLVLRELAAPRGRGARKDLELLPVLDRVDRLVVSPASPEAAARARHAEDKED